MRRMAEVTNISALTREIRDDSAGPALADEIPEEDLVGTLDEGLALVHRHLGMAAGWVSNNS